MPVDYISQAELQAAFDADTLTLWTDEITGDTLTVGGKTKSVWGSHPTTGAPFILEPVPADFVPSDVYAGIESDIVALEAADASLSAAIDGRIIDTGTLAQAADTTYSYFYVPGDTVDSGLYAYEAGVGMKLVLGAKGDKGDPGTNGTNGTNGAGVAAGGTTGQYLIKSSGTDYATEWTTLVHPVTVGTYTVTGLLTAGSVKVTDQTKAANYTLVADDAGTIIECTAALTLTVPAASTLGNGSRTTIIANGGAVIIDGPGGTNVTVTDGDVASIVASNGRLLVLTGTPEVIS